LKAPIDGSKIINLIYLYLDALIVYPENKEQLAAIKAVMKVSFEQKSEIYPEYVINGIKESLQQANEGKLTT
jgi:hypothetical protein